MAEKKNPYKDLAKQLRNIGLRGDLAALVDAATRGDWDATKFVVRVVRSESFRNQYPGLIKGGNINPAISGALDTGINLSNLGSAIKTYETMLKGYTDVAKQYGYKWGRDKMLTALNADTSPDELGARLAAVQTVRTNPDAFDAWQKQAKMSGVKDFNPFKLAMKLNDRKFFNTLEAAQLQTQVGLTAKEAAAAAKDVGQPGTYNQQSLDQVVAYTRQNLQQLQPELQAAGLNPAKLVKVMANPGSFAKEMDVLAQLKATREGLARPVAGAYGQRGTGGGIALYDDEGAASYG